MTHLSNLLGKRLAMSCRWTRRRWSRLPSGREFWKQPRQAVIALADDSEGMILAAALAGRLRIPLLIRDRSDSQRPWPRASRSAWRKSCWPLMSRIGFPDGPRVAGTLRVPSAQRGVPSAQGGEGGGRHSDHEYMVPGACHLIVGRQAIEHRLIAALGAAAVRNVIVARVPDPRTGVGHSAWRRRT